MSNKCNRFYLLSGKHSIKLIDSELTTLSLCVVSKFFIRQVNTKYKSRKGDLGMNCRDDDHCINTGGGYADVTILVCRTNRFVVNSNLKQKALLHTC